MSKTTLIKKLTLSALLFSAALFAGCGGGLDGTTYAGGNGLMSIKFESNKAYLTTPVGTVQTDYQVDGDKVIIKSPQGNLVLTHDDDDTLEGPTGKLTKHTAGA